VVEVYLIDTSVWIEWFRKTDSPACQAVARLRDNPQALATTQPVTFEVLAGAPARALPAVERVLSGARLLSVVPQLDFDAATHIYRAARQGGQTVRSLMDCLIAAVAIRSGAVLLHQDRDFEVIAGIAPQLRAQSVL
jgi:predicted nucleic acid-binding protein